MLLLARVTHGTVTTCLLDIRFLVAAVKVAQIFQQQLALLGIGLHTRFVGAALIQTVVTAGQVVVND